MMMRKRGRRLPVFLCEAVVCDGLKRWRFWCPFCDRWHYHSPERGYRAAHCFSQGADHAWPEGYVLRLDPRFDSRDRDDRGRFTRKRRARLKPRVRMVGMVGDDVAHVPPQFRGRTLQ
jgi:hypothetical protein